MEIFYALSQGGGGFTLAACGFRPFLHAVCGFGPVVFGFSNPLGLQFFASFIRQN